MRNTRGDLLSLPCANTVKRRCEGRAEVSRGHSSSPVANEGPNREDRRGAETSMDEGDADRMAEMPEDSRKAAGGTCRSTERERLASAAGKENTYLRQCVL